MVFRLFCALQGDLNTRKLLSDAQWTDTTPFDEAMGPLVGQFDTLVLRTCKADVCAGLDQARFDAVQKEDREYGSCPCALGEQVEAIS